MKIAIVGTGSAGVSVVSLFPQELNEDIKIIKVDHYNALKVDQRNQATKIDKNPKTTEIQLIPFRDTKILVKEVSLYLDDPVCNQEEILKLLSMAENGDEIYRMDEYAPCLGGDLFGFKLTRDGKTVMKTEIFKKKERFPIQDEPLTRGWREKIRYTISSILKYKRK